MEAVTAVVDRIKGADGDQRQGVVAGLAIGELRLRFAIADEVVAGLRVDV